MDADCVFCKIVKKEIPSQFVEETDNLVVIEDINPQAPIHFLIVPKKHIADITKDSGVGWASIGKLAVKLAKEKEVSSFRLVHNAGGAAEIKHMHVHFLGNVSVDRKL